MWRNILIEGKTRMDVCGKPVCLHFACADMSRAGELFAAWNTFISLRSWVKREYARYFILLAATAASEGVDVILTCLWVYEICEQFNEMFLHHPFHTGALKYLTTGRASVAVPILSVEIRLKKWKIR